MFNLYRGSLELYLVLFIFIFCLPILVNANYYKDFPDDLKYNLENKKQQLSNKYQPRTKHLNNNGQPAYTNRLLLEESPYLLQHAHNPVNWYPWSEEAFQVAKQQNKLIFLSIGYSTCHWCHVMEHESFENIKIAELLNKYFISIKVDRERRPDVDATYMAAINIVNGRGGWPASLFITAEGKPLVAATYIPPNQFKQIINDVAQAWISQPKNILDYADRLNEATAEYLRAQNALGQLKETASSQARDSIIQEFDEINGGFSNAPKFPNEPRLFFLLHQLRQKPSESLFTKLSFSLHAMAQGGIYDQVGGGFHRYATDSNWNIPHFEKMLYTQAQLCNIYLNLFVLTGEHEFSHTAKEILEYVKREMTSREGGFYSATDADSEGEEGKYFVWKLSEAKQLLQKDLFTLAVDIFNITENGNFEGSNILYRTESLTSYTKNKNINYTSLLEILDRIKNILYTERSKRVPPLRDEKVITSWNGMMIDAFANGANILNDSSLLTIAEKAANFVWLNNRKVDNTLLRSFYLNDDSHYGVQEDYAYYISALITLYDITNEPTWLVKSVELADKMLEQFWDDKYGGFYLNHDKNNFLNLTRVKDRHDGAVISANATAIRLLNRLTKRTGDPKYGIKAKQTIASFAAEINQHPYAYPGILLGHNEIKHGILSNIAYAAEGNVKIVANPDRNNSGNIDIEIIIQPGWHINSQISNQTEYIPTVISIDDRAQGWKLEKLVYPTPQNVAVKFDAIPLSVFTGVINIVGKLKKIESFENPWLRAVPLSIKLQACNDEICLLPEDITVYAQQF